jgi:hypothetical protein
MCGWVEAADRSASSGSPDLQVPFWSDVTVHRPRHRELPAFRMASPIKIVMGLNICIKKVNSPRK